jgi:hypothetical protein
MLKFIKKTQKPASDVLTAPCLPYSCFFSLQPLLRQPLAFRILINCREDGNELAGFI